MATTSSRSFKSYSGLDQQQQMQGLPSVTQRTPQQTAVMQRTTPWALPLSDRPAKQIGRSWYDPARQAERLVRGTARPGQMQGALFAQQQQLMNQDPIDAALAQGFDDIGGEFNLDIPPIFMPKVTTTTPGMTMTQRLFGNAMRGRQFGRAGVPYRPQTTGVQLF